jgi:hypothetical protein
MKQRLFFAIIILSLVACKSNGYNANNTSNSLYDETIESINKDTYDELDWMTEEPTGGIIVYDGYKLFDIDNDGIAELFIIRRYVNNQVRYVFDKNQINNIGDYNKFAIRQGFISESYKIIDGKVEPLIIDNEMVSTQAFQGGHFGTFYFLFDDGKVAKYDSSYWEENLAIYDKLKFETLISYIGDMNTGKWDWEIDKKKVNKSDVINIIKNINIHGR